jgi:hypothetical protein
MGAVAAGTGRAAAVAAALALVVLPGPVPAAAGTVQQAVGWSGGGDADHKMAYAPCPAGRRPVGAGVDLDGARRHAGLIRLPVRPDGAGVNGIASEGQLPYTRTWSVRAYAFCHVTPAQWKVVSAVTTAGSPKTRSASASCPAGTRVLGVGGGILAGSGEVMLDDLRIGADLTGVWVTGTEDGDGFAGQWRVQAQAVCAAVQPGQQRIAVTSPTNSNEFREVVVTCPVGRQVHGAGAELTGAQGQVRIRAIRPRRYSGGRSVEVLANEQRDGYGGAWSLTGYAVCAA